MRSLLALFTCLLLFGPQAWGEQRSSRPESFVDRGKKSSTVWHNIPFYAGGDIASYEATMAKNREQVRKAMFSDLMQALNQSASSGANVEAMVEPLANIIVMFDKMHDVHKARDLNRINFSIESQFKAALDAVYLRHRIPEPERKFQISRGADPETLKAYFSGAGKRAEDEKVGRLTASHVRYAQSLHERVDYLAYGTFSSLGSNQFQLTLHLQNARNGMMRSFVVRGPLIAAVDTLAQNVVDYFQKNDYALPAGSSTRPQWHFPIAPASRRGSSDSAVGYSFQEARTYCQERGFRLPYSRELLYAETLGPYRDGGIDYLDPQASYPVLDQRHSAQDYVLRIADAKSSGGVLQPASVFPHIAQFWCVKATPSARINAIEAIWKLHRENESGDGSNKELFAAVETLRLELDHSDTGAGYYNNTCTKDRFEEVALCKSVAEALEILRKNGKRIDWPEAAVKSN